MAGYAMLCSLSKVDFTVFSKLSEKVKNTNIETNEAIAKLYITSDKNMKEASQNGVQPQNMITEMSIMDSANNIVETFTLGISNVSEGYIMFSNNGEYGKASSITVSEIWLHN